MRIVPVLDLMNGVVVRGVGGRRQEYQPIVSRLTPSCQPVDVAMAFRAHFGLSELYLADLDAIAGRPPALALYAELRAKGFRLWVDAGVRDARQAEEVSPVESVILGLETIRGPDVVAEACAALGPERVVFSLDLKHGVPLGNASAWDRPEAESIVRQAIAMGVRRVLVLDLARVGEGKGTGTDDLCRRLKASDPGIEVAAGGGVRDETDLQRLRDCGVDAVLVASALHDGRIARPRR